MDELILETTFLVDLEREAAGGGAVSTADPEPATGFLDAHPDALLRIAWVTAGELACGPEDEARPGWRRLVRRFSVLEPDEETCWIYGRTWRYLRRNGLLIGANDLWVAAAALRTGLPLVTRDEERFRRVPGLRVLGY